MRVSHCCGKQVYTGTWHEYPLGGNTWSQSYKALFCSGCNKECDEVPGCDWCGEPASDGELHPVGFDKMHKHCKAEFIELNPEVAG